jgi:DNA-nicking Smr family endonuclease
MDLADGTFRRLRRGELPVDARLDLHGKRADEARDALEAFLKDKRQRRDRVVLVIHGRGEHSPAGIGVLRGEIAAWLSQGRPSQHVAAFATAQTDDGGEGALYVLLRP